MKKLVLIMFIPLLFVVSVSAFSVESPVNNQTYNETNLSLIINSNETYDNISYVLNEEYFLLCENCSNTSVNISAEIGNNTINVTALSGNETKHEDITFFVEIIEENETVHEMLLVSPENKTYNTSIIPLEISSNTTWDTIYYILNDQVFTGCENCTNITGEFNLSEGNYSLTVRSHLNNTFLERNAKFEVRFEPEEEEEEKEKETPDLSESRFSEGFQHLPRMFENDEVTDEELAKIIRENQLNPGIINRLIKTQKLGEESIDAILDTQFNPPGIFRRFLSFVGFSQSTYSSLIYENYDLTPQAKASILTREDILPRHVEQIRQSLRDEVVNASEQRTGPPSTPPGIEKKDEKKSVGVGRQNGFIPPGQAKRN